MNGRVYDPTLGRFISADPTVPDPFNSQSYDRYSYVYNNPLASTDPSGFGPNDAAAPKKCKDGTDAPCKLPHWTDPATGSRIRGNDQGATCAGSGCPAASNDPSVLSGNHGSVSPSFNDLRTADNKADLSWLDHGNSGWLAALLNYAGDHGSIDINFEYNFIATSISFNTTGVTFTAFYGPGYGVDISAQFTLSVLDDPKGLIGGTILTAGEGWGGSVFAGAGKGGVVLQGGAGLNAGYAAMGVVGVSSRTYTWSDIANYLRGILINVYSSGDFMYGGFSTVSPASGSNNGPNH
jgi:hypothetical protein